MWTTFRIVLYFRLYANISIIFRFKMFEFTVKNLGEVKIILVWIRHLMIFFKYQFNDIFTIGEASWSTSGVSGKEGGRRTFQENHLPQLQFWVSRILSLPEFPRLWVSSFHQLIAKQVITSSRRKPVKNKKPVEPTKPVEPREPVESSKPVS